MSTENEETGIKPSPARKPKNVIVVGMPRSGTSLAARVFAKKGYYVTSSEQDELPTGDEQNPFGYWEAESLIKLNVEILNRAGFPFHNTWTYGPIRPEHLAKIHGLDRTEVHRAYLNTYDEHSPWVWKDPRLCYTLAYWWPMMNPNTTSVLLLRRNPDEIYQSFRRMNWRSSSEQDKKDVFLRIDDHLKAAEQAIGKYNIPYIEINDQEYLLRPTQPPRELLNSFL